MDREQVTGGNGVVVTGYSCSVTNGTAGRNREKRKNQRKERTKEKRELLNNIYVPLIILDSYVSHSCYYN